MRKAMAILCSLGTRFFAGWVVLAALTGLLFPEFVKPVLPHVPILLGLIMFGMGLTLSAADFRWVLHRPLYVLAGAAAQFTVMPLIGYLLAVLFHLPPELAVGVVLVGAAPGGTASNVITWFAAGDVAFSVTMTSVSTLLAPLATPWLTLWLAGRWVPVPSGEMFLSVVKVILLPVALGGLIRRFLPRLAQGVKPVLPLVSVIGIMLIIAGVVGINAAKWRTSGGLVFAVVLLHNMIGLLLGYTLGWSIRMNEPQRRALSIEVGMQNSGLAVSLALTHFTPAAALAGAIFSVWQNLSGALLATIWARRPAPAMQNQA